MDQSFDNFYYKEIAKLAGAGGWQVDFINKKTRIDPSGRSILKLSDDYRATLSTLVEFYPEGIHRDKAIQVFMDCSKGEPFDTIVKMKKSSGELFWVHAIGKPYHDENQNIIGIQGVFVDINEEKTRELELENSLKKIKTQNEKLRNFTHIVSHNLRSHTSNLQLAMELMKMSNPAEPGSDEDELRESLISISENLNTTISHLNEIVNVQYIHENNLRPVMFETVWQRVINIFEPQIRETKAEIFTDFSEFPELLYVEAYLESVLHNLLSNALKYKHPERAPYIQLYTFYKDEKPCLLFKDNGIGIDLNLHGDELFNLYKTFQGNKDAVGLGLFMTRNQIETLNGTIEVDSILNKYTTFTIQF